MADLILTDEEKAAHSWLDLDDASLGRCLKRTALSAVATIDEDQRRRQEEGEAILWVASCSLLIGMMMERDGIGQMEYSLDRTREGADNGKIHVSVRLEPRSPSTGRDS